MASFLFNTTVTYACACGILNPLSSLYFCRHCLNLRCGNCLSNEVDSHFCFNCLENIPSSEAKHKKYRCNSCFDCPSCQHTLSARGTNVSVSKKSDGSEESKSESEIQKTTKKMFYLSCLACRWTTRDVGIPDQTVATGSWPEPEYSHSNRLASLMEYHQTIVLQEKQEKQEYWRRKTPKQHKFPSLTDRTGITVSMVRRQLGWTDKTSPKIKPAEIKSSEPQKVTEDDLPEDIFTKEVNLKKFTTISQRLAQPAGQPYTVNNLFPQHKSLSIKRSLRCRQCEHNIIKPEFNPTSIKYRIQLFASYHVPEIRLIQSSEALVNGQNCSIQLKFINPTINEMTITIMPLPTEDEEADMIEEMKRCSMEKRLSTSNQNNSSLNSSLTKTIVLNEDEPRPVNRKVNAKLILPDSSFVLNHRDESSEFDEEFVQKTTEEPKFILWRKANKVAIRLEVAPELEKPEQESVVVGFTVQFTHVNTSVNASMGSLLVGGGRESQVHALTSRVYIDLGLSKCDA